MKAKAVLKENKKLPEKGKAVLKKFRMSPRKARLVVDMVRGMNVLSALRLLKYDVRKAAGPVGKLIASSIANWRNKNNRESSELYISEIRVDGGGMIKRIKPAPQGRAHRIRKRYNHISVVINEKKDTNSNKELPGSLKKTKQKRIPPKTSAVSNNKINSKDKILLKEKEDKTNSDLNLKNSTNLGNVKKESAEKNNVEEKNKIHPLKNMKPSKDDVAKKTSSIHSDKKQDSEIFSESFTQEKEKNDVDNLKVTNESDKSDKNNKNKTAEAEDSVEVKNKKIDIDTETPSKENE